MTPITGLLHFDELMAGLVPDRGREDCLAAASRYLAVWLFTSQLTPAIPSRKQPETANIITLADRRSAAVHGITAVRAPVVV
jgi:hypothetical protein